MSIRLRAAIDVAQASAEAWATVFAKERLLRRQVDLGFNPADHSQADYDAVADYMAPLEEEASRARQTPAGLRWRYHGDSVLFEMSRVLNAPYDEFVERVDIASAIRMMNDYIGGASAVVSRDAQGRILRQAERNVYLPQPNWIALSGGDVIDVCKLEVIRYEDDWRRIAWRTIHSPNGSAVHDDGTVTYERQDGDRTLVTIRGLQEFTLPPFWAAMDPWLAPAVKDALVEDSYRRFFTATLDNVEACYEGRDYRVGRDREQSDDQPAEERLKQTWSVLRQLLPDRPLEALARQVQSRSAPQADEVDDDGFRHFSGGRINGAKAAEPPVWSKAVRGWFDEWAEILAEETTKQPPGGG
ncbi:MAG: hypothetical protein ABJA93_06455 [Sporichthyaceae bacterium]